MKRLPDSEVPDIRKRTFVGAPIWPASFPIEAVKEN